MMIKSLGGVLCGLLVACGGVVQTPAARVAVIDSCAGTSVRSAAQLAGYRGCARITGDLNVSGVTSLAALSELQRVDGSFSVANTERLESLAGLERLESVGRLQLRNNRRLTDLSQLADLQQAREVAIEGNP